MAGLEPQEPRAPGEAHAAGRRRPTATTERAPDECAWAARGPAGVAGRDFVRVLLVENELINAKAVLRFLSHARPPYSLAVATTCAEARTRLATEPFDLVLLDYRLPDGTGLDLVADLTASTGRTSIPVIFVTGNGNEAVAVEAMRRGAADYLIKDIDRLYLARLPDAMRRALERRRDDDARERLLRDLTRGLCTECSERLRRELGTLGG